MRLGKPHPLLHRVIRDIGEQPIVFSRHGLGVGQGPGFDGQRLTGEQIEKETKHEALILQLTVLTLAWLKTHKQGVVAVHLHLPLGAPELGVIAEDLHRVTPNL